jgi:8-oxo-dGTP pyrophosphatase MutT (NUDIX family)
MTEQGYDLLAGLKERLAKPLPGSMAHEQMRAVPTGPLVPRFEHAQPPRPGSVLILLFPGEAGFSFPLIRRPDYGGTHSGQVSLPGGKAEAGEDSVATALREAWEEVGVPQHQVEVVGTLSPFFVIPSNFMVTPVLGFTPVRPIFTADTVEVERILFGNLDDLIREDAVREKEILAARRFPLRAPYFEIDGEVVWGATAMMLNELRVVLREIVGK